MWLLRAQPTLKSILYNVAFKKQPFSSSNNPKKFCSPLSCFIFSLFLKKEIAEFDFRSTAVREDRAGGRRVQRYADLLPENQVKIPSFQLNDGRDMPALGYGTWMGMDENSKFNTADFPKMKEALSYAIDIGYRHIDTAQVYRVEPEIGEVVADKIKNGIVKREDLFITTKINLTLGQQELVEFCQKNKIGVVAYWPFGAMEPSRSTADTPEPRIDNPTMVAIAKTYNKTVSQICLRYLLERGIILSIPKTITKSRVLENAQIFDFKLSKKDFETIEKFDVNFRVVRPVYWEPFENYPFNRITQNAPDVPISLREWKNGINADID